MEEDASNPSTAAIASFGLKRTFMLLSVTLASFSLSVGGCSLAIFAFWGRPLTCCAVAAEFWGNFTTKTASAASSTKEVIVKAGSKTKEATSVVGKNIAGILSSFNEDSEAYKLDQLRRVPWYHEDEETAEKLQKEILMLAHYKKTFINNTLPSSWEWDVETHVLTAKACLSHDPQLAKARARLVPRVICEEEFWKNYMYSALIIRNRIVEAYETEQEARASSLLRSNHEDTNNRENGLVRSSAYDDEEEYSFASGEYASLHATVAEFPSPKISKDSDALPKTSPVIAAAPAPPVEDIDAIPPPVAIIADDAGMMQATTSSTSVDVESAAVVMSASVADMTEDTAADDALAGLDDFEEELRRELEM